MTTPVLLTNPNVEHRFGRPLAVLSLVCSLAHIPLLSTHFTSAPVVTAVMAVLALACIPCARKLWAAPTTQDCVVAAALAAAMVGLHSSLRCRCLPTSTTCRPGCRHTCTTKSGPPAFSRRSRWPLRRFISTCR